MTAQVVYITGAASGIGLATAHRFAETGAELAISDLDGARLSNVRREIEDRWGVRTASYSGDLGSEEAANAFAKLALSELGPANVLVNCAGIARMGTVPETSVADWDAIFSTNVRSVFLVSKAVLPSMQEHGGAVIVNVASEAGLVGFPGYAAYASSKAAVVNLTRCMALDHASQGIRVNAVCPGSIDTPLLQQYFDASRDAGAARREDAEAHPLGIGQPEDIAAAIYYLSSPDASYVTGHALVVDGGYTAK